MKKLILITGLFLLTLSGYSQFTVDVTVTGSCVYPQENTFYWAHVKVYLGTVLIAEGQGTSSTSSIPVNIDEFCVNDNTKQYTIVTDAMKAYITPFSRICKGTTISSLLYSCEDFVTGNTDQEVEME